MENKIVILGGGVAALGAAYCLVKKGVKPIIIEKAGSMGGLASSYRINNFNIEKFYHHFFPTDALVFELSKELGIKNRISWRNTKMGFYYRNKLYGFTSPLDIMLFEPLSFRDRIKFGIEMLRIARSKNYASLDKISAKEWLIKTFGNSIYDKIFKPLLQVKFAMSMDKASAAFVYGRLRARAVSRTRSLSSEKLGYMKGGYNSLLTALQSKIKNHSEILYNAEIMEVEHKKEFYDIKIKRMGKIEVVRAKFIINTLPLEVFSKMAKNFPQKIMASIRKIKYQAIICAAIGLKKKLSDYYWINISSADLPFHGVIEHTNFIPSSYYSNNNIAYVFNYVTPEHKFWLMDEKGIKKAYIEGLARMFPHIKKTDVLWFRLSRERYATPIFLKGYEENMKRIENTSNMYFAGSFKIYPFSRNVNNVIKTGIDAAYALLKENNL